MGAVELKEVAGGAGGLKGEINDFKRRRIREEATHLFFENGYASTTIETIAKRLNVTKPFIYSHYKNKSELLFDISRTGIELSLEAMDRANAVDRSPADKLRLLVEDVLRIIIDYQEYIVVYEREEKNLDPALARQIREQRNLFDHKLAELLEQGHACGDFVVHDAVLTATTIGGMMTWVSFWYLPGGKRTELEILNHVMSTVEAVVHNKNDDVSTERARMQGNQND